MNPLEDEIFRVLKAMEEHGVLDHVMVIGSWTTLFYKDYFDDPDYHPAIRTTDIDFLVAQKPPKGLKLDISSILQGLGFLPDYSYDGWLTFQKPDLHIEFLWPRLGPKTDEVKKIPELGINVRPLRFMWLLAHYPIICTYKGIKLKIAHPAAYGLHKLIISTRRTKPFKRDNDRQQAEMVLTALTKSTDKELLYEILNKLSSKEWIAMKKAIQGNQQLESILLTGKGHTK